jgi:hypothetical protein
MPEYVVHIDEAGTWQGKVRVLRQCKEWRGHLGEVDRGVVRSTSSTTS